MVSDLGKRLVLRKSLSRYCAVYVGAALLQHVRVAPLAVRRLAFDAHGANDAGDPDEWAAMMDLNLNSPMRLTARFAPGMVTRCGLCDVPQAFCTFSRSTSFLATSASNTIGSPVSCCIARWSKSRA